MANDYRGFQDKISGDLGQASMAAHGMDKDFKKASKVRIRNSDIEGLVPSGSLVEFMPMACHRMKFGDILFIRQNKEFVLRRFVSFQVNKSGPSVIVARVSPPALEKYSDTSVVGKISKVDSKGTVYDPHKKEPILARLGNHWSCFGTSSPFQRLGQNLKIFGKMMVKK